MATREEIFVRYSDSVETLQPGEDETVDQITATLLNIAKKVGERQRRLQPLIGTPLPDLAQVVSPFELRAINDPARAFCVIDRFVTDAPKRCPAARGPRSEGHITNEPAKPNIAPLGGAIYVS
jgi:hypothetical protein